MKTILSRSVLLCVYALVSFSTVAKLSAQKADNPVYVNLSFSTTVVGTGGWDPAELGIYMQDETGANVYSTIVAYDPWTPVSSGTLTAKLYMNKSYTLSVFCYNGEGTVNFEPVDEYAGALLDNGGSYSSVRFIGSNQNEVWTIRVGTPQGQPLAGIPGDLRAGEGSSIVADKPIWYLGLGKMRNGDSAGAIGFRKTDFSASNFFTTSALHYSSPDTAEVDVITISNALRQVFSREVLVDIQTVVANTSYKLDVYARSQVTGFSGGLHTTTGSPSATYTVSKIIPSGGTGVKITRAEDGVTWETSLELVSNIWTHRDWRVQGATADSKVTTNFTSGTAATISHSGPNAAGSGNETPLVWNKTYTQHSWGIELDKKTFGPSETVKVETQRSYYTTTGSGALAEYLKWIKQPDGSWTKFEYYETNASPGYKGEVKRTYRQWLDTSATPDTATTSNSAYEDWTYAADSDGAYRVPASRIDRAPGGTIISKSEWTYNHAVTTLNGRYVAQSIRYEYWGPGGTDRLATTTRYHLKNDSTKYLRRKPVSVAHPDGRKDSYAYFNGTWTESTRTFSASAGGNDRLVLCYHGQTSGGTAVSSVSNNGITWSMDTVNMVAGKSTVSETVVDIHGRVVFEAENVYTSGGTLARIAGMIYRFDSHGRLSESVDVVRSVGTGSNELKSVRSYSSGLLLTETAPEGKVTKFEYDSLLRMFRKTDGFGGPAGFPAKISEFKFDGANRLKESYSCSCGTGATLYSYDGAGRVSYKSEAAPGGGDLITSFYYDSIRKVTETLPSGATRITENFLDGRPKSVTGTAQPPATFEYAVSSSPAPEIGFLIVSRKNGSDTTNGWVEEKHDLLGRVTARSVPAWGWPTYSNNILETRFEYNTAGQLWRERTYYRNTSQYINADRLFVYDANGRLYRRGLDINNNGQLDVVSGDRNDRVVDVDETISQDGWGWQLVTTVNTYATAGSSTATEVSQSYTRLTGFNNGSLSGGKFVTGDEISFDSSDRYSVRWDYANPASKSIESDFQWQGYPSGYQKGNNGYVSEVLAKNGEKQGYEYDSRGRLSHVRGRWTGSAYAEDTAYTYHGDTQFVASVTYGGIATSYAYAWGSPSGSRKVSVTDAGGKTTHTLYNAMDLPWQVWGSAAQPAQFGYDAVGRRTSMTTWRSGSFTGTTWPGSPGTGAATAWVPEPATGLLKEKVWADHTTGVPRKWTYAYTPLGNIATRTWARNVTTTYNYFDGSTTTTSHASHKTHDLRSVTYGDGTTGSSYTYKRTGAPDQVTDFTGTRTFAYRSDLQLSSETFDSTFYGANRTITPTYEDGTGGTVNGRATGFQFKTSSTIESANTFAFSASTGRISTIAGKSGSPTFTHDYANGAAWVESITSGSYTRTNTLLSNRPVLDRVETKWGATVRSDYDSTFDSRGLRGTVVQSGTIPAAGTTTLTHDDRAELTGADFSVGTSKDYTWDYDLMGKRSTAVNNGSTTTYSAIVDADKDVNQYASITGGMAESGLAYDADGNMTQDGAWHYRYDGENRLKEMEKKDGTKTLQFAYDYLNRRVRKTIRNGTPAAAVASSTKFVWSGWQLAAELDAGTGQTGTTFLKSYLWGVDFSNGSGAAGGAGALLGVYQGGAWYHTAYDATGNLTGYLNTSGTAVATYEYNAYGQIIASGGSATSFAFGFATQYTDHESGLVYYGMRYYQPKHGRFINRDPIEEAGGLNLYSFVGNSPSNRWDVLGLSGPAPSVCTDQVCEGAPDETDDDVVVLAPEEVIGSRGPQINDQVFDAHELSSRLDESIRERIGQIEVSIDRFDFNPASGETAGGGMIGEMATRLLSHINDFPRNDLRRLFLITQHSILIKLANAEWSVGSQKWLTNLVRDFMNPLFAALEGRPNNRWADTLALVSRWQSTVNSAGSEYAYVYPVAALFAAREMALTHIDQDLRRSLIRNGPGDNADWSRVGDYVAQAERETFYLHERLASWGVGLMDSSFDVSRFRDEMRDEVVRDSL
jgi:RHS repeat-associated protein